MTDHMKTVHDIDTDIALARKEITDMNITQYAVPDKIKGTVGLLKLCVKVILAFICFLFKLTKNLKSFVRFQAAWQHLEHRKLKNIKFIEHIMIKLSGSKKLIR